MIGLNRYVKVYSKTKRTAFFKSLCAQELDRIGVTDPDVRGFFGLSPVKESPSIQDNFKRG
jgi:hypothetical protein